MLHYFNIALDSGVKASELSEIVTHIAFYSGWSNPAKPDLTWIPSRRGAIASTTPRTGNDPRQVVTDSTLGYFGGQVPENALVPDHADLLGAIHFSDCLVHSQPEALRTH
jgi:hypothetical protein